MATAKGRFNPTGKSLPHLSHCARLVSQTKIYRFAITPNQKYKRVIPPPLRGAYRERHGRWVRDAVDAAASGA